MLSKAERNAIINIIQVSPHNRVAHEKLKGENFYIPLSAEQRNALRNNRKANHKAGWHMMGSSARSALRA